MSFSQHDVPVISIFEISSECQSQCPCMNEPESVLMPRLFLDEGAGLDSEENCYDSLEDVKKRNSGRRLLPAPPASLALPLYTGQQSGKLSNTLTDNLSITSDQIYDGQFSFTNVSWQID